MGYFGSDATAAVSVCCLLHYSSFNIRPLIAYTAKEMQKEVSRAAIYSYFFP